MEELELKSRVACTDCKTPNLLESAKPSEDTRIIRFVGVTDAVSNKHRFPHEVMEQMVNDAKNRYVLPYMPSSVKEIDKKMLDVLVENKSFGRTEEPLAMRDMHDTNSQFTKVGRVLNVALKSKSDAKNGGIGRKWMEVVAEVFDPHIVRLIDRGMATKFSIGFKHRYDMVDGIKVSNFGVLDHFGFVDVPADDESVLLEAKEKEDMPGMQDCVQARVAEGMSQEDAVKACGESAGKSVFDPSGDPKAGEDRAFRDCVEGLVASGLDKDEAERACHNKSGQHHDSVVQNTTPKTAPSGEPAMKQLEAANKALETRMAQLETQTKSLGQVIQSLSAENKTLKAENLDRQINAEVKLLMEQGRVTPATKEKVIALAHAMPDEKTRDAYYETLGVVIDFETKAWNGGDDDSQLQSLDKAADEMWGGTITDIVSEIKGRRDW